MIRYLRAANVKDGVLDLSDVKEMNFTPAEQAIFALQPGDVLVTEGSGSLATVGASTLWTGQLAGIVCFQNTLVRLRPRPWTDPGYLAWWCRHAFADGLFASIASGANIFHVSAERLKPLAVASWPLDQQRAIADFLDTETGRIDALIAKKRRMIELLDERVRAIRDHHLLRGLNPVSGATPPDYPDGWRVATLGVLVELHRGYDLPADSRSEGLVPVVSSGGTSGRNAVAMCEPPGVVTGRYGTIGEVFYLDVPYWPLNTTLYVSDYRACCPKWVFHLLRALPLDYDAEKSAVTGINRNVIGQLRVPVPSFAEQAAIAGHLDADELRRNVVCDRLTRQIELLREHRQALITAAVTGELDMSGVAA